MLSPVWQKCYEDFLRHLFDYSGSEHTVANYSSVLSRFFTRYPQPEYVTRAQVEQFLRAPHDPRHTQPLSPRTRNMRLGVLSSFYHYATDYYMTDIYGNRVRLFTGISPTTGLKAVKAPRQLRLFSMADVEKIFAVIPSDVRGLRDRAVFTTLLLTSRRRSEICELHIGDIFRGTVTDPDGTQRAAWLYQCRTKGKGSALLIAELPELAKNAIDRYMQASGRTWNDDADNPLFLAHPASVGAGLPIDPFRPVTGLAIWNRLKKYARAAGLPPDLFTIHGFRHLSARERHRIGQSAASLQRLLGHASLQHTTSYLSELEMQGDVTAKVLEERIEPWL
jgi:integrase